MAFVEPNSLQHPSLFEQLGGEPALRTIINRFVDRIFDDVMIGFFFQKANRQRVKEKEYEFAAQHLGANVQYSGRALEEAHRVHPIMGGQFMRRKKILEEVLLEFGAPEAVRNHWLAHTEGLRSQVTSDVGDRCDPQAALEATQRGPQGSGLNRD